MPAADLNQLDADFQSAREELHQSLLGIHGQDCCRAVEVWEKRYCRHPGFGFAAIDHANYTRMLLLKNSSPMNVSVSGSNNTIQQGTNFAQGDGSVVAVQPQQTASDCHAVPTPNERPATISLLVSIAVAFFCVWWFLPQSWAMGDSRFYATVFAATVAVAYALIGWAHFKRRNWEKFAYIGLGAVVILSGLAPSIGGKIAGAAGYNEHSVVADVNWYVGSSDDTFGTNAKLIVGSMLIGFAFFTKSR